MGDYALPSKSGEEHGARRPSAAPAQSARFSPSVEKEATKTVSPLFADTKKTLAEASAFFAILSDKSGSLDSLYQISLTEEIYDNEGRDDHDTCRIADDAVIETLTAVVGFQ